MSLKITKETISIISIILLLYSTDSISESNFNCVIGKYKIAAVLISPEATKIPGCKYSYKYKEIYEGVKILNTYWDMNNSHINRYKLLSMGYKNRLSKYNSIKSSDLYRIPMFVYERHWLGYTVEMIKIVSNSHVEYTLHIPWAQEGNEGISTYIFSLKKVGNIFKIDNIFY